MKCYESENINLADIFDYASYEGLINKETYNDIIINLYKILQYPEFKSFLQGKNTINNSENAISKFNKSIKEINERFSLSNNRSVNSLIRIYNNISNSILLDTYTSETDILSRQNRYDILSVGDLDNFKLLNEQSIASSKIRRFNNLISNIKLRLNIKENFFPLLKGFDKESRQVKFLEMETYEIKNYQVSEEEFSQFSKFANYFHELSSLPEYTGLSKAFAIQSLFDFFKENKTSSVPLTQFEKLLKIQYYVGISQIALGVSDELIYLEHVVDLITGATLNPALTVIKNISSTANMLLSVINISLDIAVLANTRTNSENVIFGTKLGFDIGSLGLGVAALAGVEFTGPLGLILGGITPGIIGIVSNLENNKQRAIAIAQVFDSIENDYSYHDSQFHHFKDEVTTASFALNLTDEHNIRLNNSVIESLDLSDRKKIKITFGNNYLMKTEHAEYMKNGSYAQSFFGPNPSPLLGKYQFLQHPINKNDYISINEYLHIPKNKEVSILEPETLSKRLSVILPVTPITYIWYDFHPASALSEEDAKTLWKLQKNAQGLFIFTYHQAAAYKAIHDIELRYEATDINIQLGSEELDLHIPNIPAEWQNKIRYYLYGKQDGVYHLYPRNGVHYNITGTGEETFYIVISKEKTDIEFDFQNINFIDNRLLINNATFIFDKNNKPKNVIIVYNSVIIGTNQSSSIYVDIENSILKIDSIDFGNPSDMTLEEIKSKIEVKSSHFDNYGFIKINDLSLKEIEKFSREKGIAESTFKEHLNRNITPYKTSPFSVWYNIADKNFIIDPSIFSSDPIRKGLKLLGKNQDNLFFFDYSNQKIYNQDKNNNLNLFIKEKVKNVLMLKTINSISDKYPDSLAFKDLLSGDNVTVDLKSNSFRSVSVDINNNIIHYPVNIISGYKNILFNNYIKLSIKDNDFIYDAFMNYSENENIIFYSNQMFNRKKLLSLFGSKISSVYYYYYNQEAKSLILVKGSKAKVIIENVLKVNFSNNKILATLSDGYDIIFQPESPPLLIGLFGVNIDNSDINDAIIKLRRTIKDLKLSSLLSLGSNKYCYYPLGDGGFGRIISINKKQ
ncbi:TcdA/TcdB pore-forming domain-containing protein [Fluviispira vulneris]|uniref:TcdA/TcdB pore-forming domain-containing protein n=1 Tax=Fluviispira vulneris TaxID=2763012 RepID=UPI001645C2CF|nr:TcdA/TcdB pore-forming domain-containing protein [Fluviispira vulneris]